MLLGVLSLVATVRVTGDVARVPQSPARSVWQGVYTDEQAKRGQALYATHCVKCHLASLGGAEAAPPLVGGTFAATWEGTALADLFERMRSSMPEETPGSLSRQQNADLLAYMLKVGGFPAGPTPLSAEAPALAEIRYDTYRPAP